MCVAPGAVVFFVTSTIFPYCCRQKHVRPLVERPVLRQHDSQVQGPRRPQAPLLLPLGRDDSGPERGCQHPEELRNQRLRLRCRHRGQEGVPETPGRDEARFAGRIHQGPRQTRVDREPDGPAPAVQDRPGGQSQGRGL